MSAPQPGASVDELAAYLDQAQQSVTEVEQLADGLSLERAYQVQHALLARRCGRGERLVGVKLGFTSAAKMAQMGISEIIVGEITDAMAIPDGGTVDLAGLVHPRIEPEVAFRLARDVGPDDGDVDLADAVDAVAPALEVIDSRYEAFRFSLPNVVADNTSAAGFVIGDWVPLAEAGDLGDRSVQLLHDGEQVAAGSTSDILGHPLDALRALLPLARKQGFALEAGFVVLAGAATAAVPLRTGLVRADVEGLGSVSVRGTRG